MRHPVSAPGFVSKLREALSSDDDPFAACIKSSRQRIDDAIGNPPTHTAPETFFFCDPVDSSIQTVECGCSASTIEAHDVSGQAELAYIAAAIATALDCIQGQWVNFDGFRLISVIKVVHNVLPVDVFPSMVPA